MLPIERKCSSSLKVLYGFRVGNRAVASNIDPPLLNLSLYKKKPFLVKLRPYGVKGKVQIWSDEKERLCSKLSCTETKFAGDKRVQPSIFVCEFLDPGKIVLRVTDKVDYPATEWTTPPFFLVVFVSRPFWDHSPFSQPSIGRTPLSHTQRRFQAR